MDGLKIERYYHFICKTDTPLFELLAELGLSDRLKWTDTRMGYYFDGHLYKWGTPMANRCLNDSSQPALLLEPIGDQRDETNISDNMLTAT